MSRKVEDERLGRNQEFINQQQRSLEAEKGRLETVADELKHEVEVLQSDRKIFEEDKESFQNEKSSFKPNKLNASVQDNRPRILVEAVKTCYFKRLQQPGDKFEIFSTTQFSKKSMKILDQDAFTRMSKMERKSNKR